MKAISKPIPLLAFAFILFWTIELGHIQIRSQSFGGRVQRKYIVHSAHGAREIRLDGELSGRSVPNQQLYDAIDSGDYIIKRKWATQMFVDKRSRYF